jgi:N-methylhydantoinase B
MRGGVMSALLPLLANDIPWSTGGLMRCFDLIAEEGTLTNATFPAAIGRAPIGPAWMTGTLVADCLSQMLDGSAELGKFVQASCCGTWDTATIAGLDERGAQPVPFLNVIMEPMAGGYGARPHTDGIDTGGLFCIPMGRIPDVEMTEFLYPLLTLWRREEPDSGGPGRHRGGVSASVAVTAHGTSVPMALVVASGGKAVAQNGGLCGGLPGNTGLDVIARQSRVAELLAAGRLPSELSELSDVLETSQCYGQGYLAPGDVLSMHWQGGGGYGDPLLRDPEAVAHDVRERRVTWDAAATAYGVVVREDAVVDEPATLARRADYHAARRDRSRPIREIPAGRVDASVGRRLDDNLVEATWDGRPVVACRHCGQVLGDPRAGDTLALARYQGAAAEAGPQILGHPEDYVDAPVSFRQYCCPGCWTAIYSAVVPADHQDDAATLSRLVPTAAPAG